MDYLYVSYSIVNWAMFGGLNPRRTFLATVQSRGTDRLEDAFALQVIVEL